MCIRDSDNPAITVIYRRTRKKLGMSPTVRCDNPTITVIYRRTRKKLGMSPTVWWTPSGLWRTRPLYTARSSAGGIPRLPDIYSNTGWCRLSVWPTHAVTSDKQSSTFASKVHHILHIKDRQIYVRYMKISIYSPDYCHLRRER